MMTDEILSATPPGGCRHAGLVWPGAGGAGAADPDRCVARPGDIRQPGILHPSYPTEPPPGPGHEHRPEPVPEEVRTLGQEGRKMCSEGHVRPGILRLRRALQILRGEEADPR